MELKSVSQGLAPALTEKEQLNTLIERLEREHGAGIIERLQMDGVPALDAEHAMKGALTKAFCYLRRVEMPRKPSGGWLLKIARNLVKDDNRTQFRTDKRLRGFAKSGIVRDGFDPADESRRSELSEAMTAAIASLTHSQQKVVRRYFFENYNKAEIARNLGISPNAVDGLINRALKRMRKELTRVWPVSSRSTWPIFALVLIVVEQATTETFESFLMLLLALLLSLFQNRGIFGTSHVQRIDNARSVGGLPVGGFHDGFDAG